MVERLVAHVPTLAEPYRSVILERYFEDASPREIAKRSGEPLETIRTRHRRALAQLRAALDRDVRGGRSQWVAGLCTAIGFSPGVSTVVTGAVAVAPSTNAAATPRAMKR